MGCSAVQLRPELLEPHQLGQRQRAVAAVAGDMQKAVCAHGCFQSGRLCLCPSVGIEDRIAHRLQPVVQRDQILHLTAHGNGGDLTGSRLSGKFPRDRAEGIPPAGGILLLHAAVKDGGDIDGPLCRHRSVFVCQNALDCRCSRVEGRNIPFFHGAPSPHRWSPRPARWAMTERMIMPPVMMLCI